MHHTNLVDYGCCADPFLGCVIVLEFSNYSMYMQSVPILNPLRINQSVSGVFVESGEIEDEPTGGLERKENLMRNSRMA